MGRIVIVCCILILIVTIIFILALCKISKRADENAEIILKNMESQKNEEIK